MLPISQLTIMWRSRTVDMLANISDSLRRSPDDLLPGQAPDDRETEMAPNIPERERQRRELQRAMRVRTFCKSYNIGRTFTYAEIKAGRLKARKAGRRTVIAQDDAEQWLSGLPAFHEGLNEPSRETSAAAEVRGDASAQSLPLTPTGADTLRENAASARATAQERTRFRADARKKTARSLARRRAVTLQEE